MFKSQIILYLVIFLVYICFASVVDKCCDENLPIAKTKYGDVRGTIMKSRKGKLFAAFRGIPYAEPPIGPLRFKAPKEIGKWKGVKNATKDAPICMQQNFLFTLDPPIEGSEDCLYLNVYSPKAFCETRRTKLLPVFVFIHYGAFMAGDSRSNIIGPELLMDKDIIVVTFNYRLGVLGFLSTYDDEAPGNWAFKDQLAALKWVKNNIHYFGGNNKKVTISGQSAGAGSVHHHILSTSSKGLFQAAITMSGSALGLWAKPMKEIHLTITNYTALSVGCVNADTISLIRCLRNVSATALINAANVFRFLRSEPLTPYLVAIETKSVRNPEPFITEDPYDIITKGKFQNIPWIIGATNDEGILRAAPFVRQEDTLAKINADFDDNLKKMLALQLSTGPDTIDDLWLQVKNFYFKGQSEIEPSNSNSISGLIDLYSDRAFIYPAYQMMQLHKRMGHKHIFVYNFNYKGKYTYGDLFAATPHEVKYKWGVCHCDDLLYLLHSPGLFPNYELPEIDTKMSDILVNFFANFALYRDPAPKHLLENKHQWQELPDGTLNETTILYLDISGSFEDNFYQLNMTKGYYEERMKFWETKSLYENFNITDIK